MGYKMRSSISEMLGLNEEHSTPDIPVVEESMPKNVWGYASVDRVVHINNKLNKEDKAKAVEHEKEHVMQMRKGLVSYDHENVYYRTHPLKQFTAYPRDEMKEGAHNLPWEKDVYNKTKTYAK
jgi:hypothetical protein